MVLDIASMAWINSSFVFLVSLNSASNSYKNKNKKESNIIIIIIIIKINKLKKSIISVLHSGLYKSARLVQFDLSCGFADGLIMGQWDR